MDKYAEYLDDAEDGSAESTKMMKDALAQTQVCYSSFLSPPHLEHHVMVDVEYIT